MTFKIEIDAPFPIDFGREYYTVDSKTNCVKSGGNLNFRKIYPYEIHRWKLVGVSVSPGGCDSLIFEQISEGEKNPKRIVIDQPDIKDMTERNRFDGPDRKIYGDYSEAVKNGKMQENRND